MIDWLRRILPPYTGGSSDTVFGIAIYGNHKNRRWLVSLARWWHRRVLRRIDKCYYWFHGRLIRRYHIVKTDLRPGWCDVDEVMFRACFALLGRFVEYELGYATVDNDDQYRGYRLHCEGGTDEAAIDLWRWYQDNLPRLEGRVEDDFLGLEELKEKKLAELMAMRHTLWT